MFNIRLVPLVFIGSLMAASAFAATPTTTSASPTSALTKDQISTIQKDCSKANGGSMVSQAYQACVKSKEDAAVAKAAHK